MEPKREVKNKKQNVDSTQQHQQRKQNRQRNKNKKNKSNNQNKDGVIPKSISKETIVIENDNKINDSIIVDNNNNNNNNNNTNDNNNNNNVAKETDDLSVNEKVDLNKNILELKKQKEEYNHSHKKEKQKKVEERKKLINDSLHKKHEEAKQLKIKEEEKKKLLEKQRIETQKELDKIKQQQHQQRYGSMRGSKKITDEKLLDIFKRKSSHSNLSNGSLRKYSSHNSIGIKSSTGIFRTISIPRLSKEQISLLDLFSVNGNQTQNQSFGNLTTSSNSSNNNSTSPSLLSSYNSFRTPKDLYDQFKKSSTGTGSGSSLRLSLKDDFYSKSNTHKRWEEYAKTLLPTEREEIKKKKEQDRITKLEELSKSPNEQLLSGSGSGFTPMSPKRMSTHQSSPRHSLLLQQQQQHQISSTSLTSVQSIEEKTMEDDGKKIINALLNKTHSTPRSFACFDNNFSTLSQKPPQIVNIFKYGSVDINFSEVFGDIEDLQGFIMWSVHSFSIEERELSDYSKFYSRDCYLVLNINPENSQTSDSNMYNLHIWIGKDSPRERVSTAVMMSIQLSTHLSGKVNHYREEQGQESKNFTQYFLNKDMNGIHYHNGSSNETGSDFNSTLETPMKRKTHLYKIDIPPISIEKSGVLSVRRMGLSKKLIQSSSQEVSWLLENDEKILILLGSKSSIQNKIQTRKLALELLNYYSKKIQIIDYSSEPKEFFKYLKNQKSKSDKPVDSDDDETIVNLYKTCIKQNGKLGLQPISEDYPMSCELLLNNENNNSEEVFILDCTTNIFIYSSNTVSKKKIAAAKECAKIFFNEYERPKWAEITEIYKGNEPPLFKYQFSNWPEQDVNSFKPKSSIVKKSLDDYYNFEAINSSPCETQKLPFENDETDQVDTYLVSLPDLEFFKLPEQEKSIFYEDDCFMTIITSRKERGFDDDPLDFNQPKTIIYWWQGVNSDQKGYSSFIYGLYPIIAAKFQDKGQPKPIVEPINQRKEPKHFLDSFVNPIVIHKGSKFEDPEITTRVYQLIIEDSLICIQEINQNNIIFNSFNIYFLVSPLNDKIVIWRGEDNSYSLDDDDLLSYSQLLDEEFEVELVIQGEETDEFWALLPFVDYEFVVSVNYSADKLFRFHLDPKSSELRVNRINRKYPSDLDEKECCLLETEGNGLYLWVGSNCSQTLIQLAYKYLNDYYYNNNDNKNKIEEEKLSLENLKYEYQFSESLEFKLHFASWERKDYLLDPLETRQNHNSIQKTLDYRKQCQEDVELFKEYLDYVNTINNEDELEDFETWTLIKKGLIDPSIFNNSNNNSSGSLKVKGKKKGFFKMFSTSKNK